jgi:hypothetical protein
MRLAELEVERLGEDQPVVDGGVLADLWCAGDGVVTLASGAEHHRPLEAVRRTSLDM